MVTRIVSDDKIQITILILMWGALSKSVLFYFKATVLMFQHDPIHYVLVTAVKVALLL